jgi:hypothetical protein
VRAFKYPMRYPTERLVAALSEYCPECWDRLVPPSSWGEKPGRAGWQIVARYACPCGNHWTTWHSRALLGWVAPALSELQVLP